MKLFNDADITYQQLFHVTEHSFYKVFARPLSDISSKADIDFVNAERQLRYGPQYILPAEYSYEYNLICNDPHRRIITIDFGDDIAIVVLKRVQMFQNVYTRIEGIPISRSRNKHHELHILTILAATGLAYKIGGCLIESEILDQMGYPFSEEISSYNFYSYIPSNFAKINRNKWKHKKGIKRMEKMSGLTVKFLVDKNQKDLDDISRLNGWFDRWKKEVEGTKSGWKKLQKSMSKHPYWLDQNIISYLFRYKDIPVAYVVYVTGKYKTAHQIINKSIGRAVLPEFEFTDQEQQEFDEIRRRIPAFIHYKTIKDLNERGYAHGYFGGAFSMKSLRGYKTMMNDLEVSQQIHKLSGE
tara:strand:+ start:1749 stop:2816 length:1068 start_codon:yes stop_codon:yes gene_type:complete